LESLKIEQDTKK